jgi:hypothetical protein
MCLGFSLFASGHSFFFVLPPPLFLPSPSLPPASPFLHPRAGTVDRRTEENARFRLSSSPVPLPSLAPGPIYVGVDQRSGIWSLSSSREITDRRSSSAARAVDSSHRASRCGHQSLVKARLVVEMPMREGGKRTRLQTLPIAMRNLRSSSPSPPRLLLARCENWKRARWPFRFRLSIKLDRRSHDSIPMYICIHIYIYTYIYIYMYVYIMCEMLKCGIFLQQKETRSHAMSIIRRFISRVASRASSKVQK